MPYYSWQAINLEGNIVTGRCWAVNSSHIRTQLLTSELGLMHCAPWKLSKYRSFGRTKKLIEALSSLKILMSAGLPLIAALRSVSTDDIVTQQMMEAVADGIEQGNSLAQCLEPFVSILSETACRVLSVAASHGKIVEALTVLIEQEEQVQQYRRQIFSSCSKPLLNLMTLIVLAVGAIIFILPCLEQITGTISNSFLLVRLISYVPLAGMCTAVSLLALGIAIGIYFVWPRYKRVIDYVVLQCPVINACVLYGQLATIWEQLGMLTYVGVPLAQAMQEVQTLCNNGAIEDAFKHSYQSILYGQSVDQALEPLINCGPISCQKILVIGVRSGDFSAAAEKIGFLLRQQRQRAITHCIALLGPILLLFSGALVAILLVAIIEPIMSLPELMSQL